MPTAIAASGHLGSYAVAAVEFLNAHAHVPFGDTDVLVEHRVGVLDGLRTGVPLFDIVTESDILESSAFDGDGALSIERVQHAAHALNATRSIWGNDLDPDALLRLLFARGLEVSLGLDAGQDADQRSRYWYIDLNIVANQPCLHGALRAVDHQNGDGHVTMTLFTPGSQPIVDDYMKDIEGRINPVWHAGQKRAFWYVYDLGGPIIVEPTLECGGEEPWQQQVAGVS